MALRSDAAVVGRLAPSPTGLLHLGHARSFLLAWWHARSCGGRVVLRLEDLDGDRSKPALADAALRDLEWLGIDWDGVPYVQSSGRERLQCVLSALLESGQAYPCVCTRADVRAAASAPHRDDREVRYPGTCRGRFASVAQARRQTGKPAAVRFTVAEGSVRVADGFAGEHEFDVQQVIGDFPIARRDGVPAYQLAAVVDDAAQGVTEVLRGDDLLPSAARQMCLQRALGLPIPRWFHVPLVQDEAGRRLAKRADDASLAALRAAGADPRAIVGWVAATAGMRVAARVAARECTAVFQLEAVPREPVRLDAGTLIGLFAAR